MLTVLGKEIRKLRIENGELLKDMADWMNVTSSYLSAIEHGKKAVPKDFVDSIVKHYQLDENYKNKLLDAAKKSIGSVRLNLVGKDEQRMEFANAFARKFDTLTDEQIKEMMDLIGGD